MKWNVCYEKVAEIYFKIVSHNTIFETTIVNIKMKFLQAFYLKLE